MNRGLPFWLGVVLVATYTIRAVMGIVGGVAYSKGTRLAAEGDYYESLPYLEWAVAPQDPASLAWLRGQVRQGLWERMVQQGGRTERTDEELVAAFQDYTEAISLSPSSGWYWTNLAEIYETLELMERADEPMALGLLESGPWALVGQPGRVAIGLGRLGIEREPNVHILHDRLALTYLQNGLSELGFAAVADSARIQPLYYVHEYRDLDPVPVGLLDVFADAARGALGETPLLLRAIHYIALGRMEIQRGSYAQAAEDMRAALSEPLNRLNRLEAHYYLGVALIELGEHDEALESLELAEEHPSLLARSVSAQAVLAERTGRVQDALQLRGRLWRRIEKRNLSYILEFARLARETGEWEQAEDALKWAKLVRPGDSRAAAELIQIYLDQGDTASAQRELVELEDWGDVDADLVERLRQRLTAARLGGA